jgi:hypothetical protein
MSGWRQPGVLLHHIDLVTHRVDGAAADAAPHVGHDQCGVGEFAGVVRRHPRMQDMDSDVGRDRVEAARVDDPGAGALCRLMVLVDAVAGEQHLAGEVHVVGTGRRARAGERFAVLRVRADRRHHHAGPAGHRGQRLLVARVGDHDGQAQAETFQFRSVATGQRDPGALRRVSGEVSCHERAHETRRPVDDHVEIAWLIARAR